jgi:hypothetical protein
MKKYIPELGQASFGQPPKEFECPEYVVALLEKIESLLSKVMWNLKQKEYDSPFSNTGNKFKNKTFKVEAYNWNESITQKYNFKWEDVEISWYKYLGRGSSINQKITKTKAIRMFNECIKSIRDIDYKY